MLTLYAYRDNNCNGDSINDIANPGISNLSTYDGESTTTLSVAMFATKARLDQRGASEDLPSITGSKASVFLKVDFGHGLLRSLPEIMTFILDHSVVSY